jgi:hypothetical protein
VELGLKCGQDLQARKRSTLLSSPDDSQSCGFLWMTLRPTIPQVLLF